MQLNFMTTLSIANWKLDPWPCCHSKSSNCSNGVTKVEYHLSRIPSYPPTPTPTQKFKTWLPMFGSQKIDSSLVSLEMIFEAPQSELFKILKIWVLKSSKSRNSTYLWFGFLFNFLCFESKIFWSKFFKIYFLWN